MSPLLSEVDMYIQITERCNMSCAHCGHGCTAVGNDMDVKTFAQSCKLAVKFHYDICLGGGEPTLHKDLERFLEIGLDHSNKVGLVTNGSNTKMSLFLAELAADGIVSCTLSLDKYHDRSMVSQDVIDAFQKDHTDKNDQRYIQDVSAPDRSVVRSGRAITSEAAGFIDQKIRDSCFGLGFHVNPDGRLYHCGCKTLSYNNVFNPTFHPNIFRARYTCAERDPWRKYLRMPLDDEDKEYVWTGY